MDNIKEYVRDATKIEEVIAEAITVTAHHKAVCPFHEDTKPSLSINVKEQYFHCFGCAEGTW